LVKKDKKLKKNKIMDEILKDARTQYFMQPNLVSIATSESVGSFRQGLGLKARHSNCRHSWNGQLDSSLVDGNRVQRLSNRGKALSRNIWNRVETKNRNGVKEANSKSRN
jgi:hypothetical protein